MSETPTPIEGAETEAETEETQAPQEDPQPADSTEEQETPEPEQEAEEDAEEDQPGTPTAKLRAEAKKYRQRLRDTETERDQLTEQLTAARSEIVQAAMTEHTAKTVLKPDDVYLFTKTTPADYLTEAGTTDADKITATVDQLLKDRPELAKPQQGFDTSRGKQRLKTSNGFRDAFKPR